MNFIDSILNRITMYRVVLYYLIALLVAAMGLGTLHILPYSPVSILFSTGVLLASSLATNVVLGRVWKAVPGSASSYITALILALIVSPVAPTDIHGVLFLIALGAWAMASKYFFAVRGKHVFNPAAFAVALSALALGKGATWWVAGNLALLPLVFLGGLLVVRKIQRFDLVLSFFAAALVTSMVTSHDPLAALWATIAHSAIFFLAFAMLTEPATMPPTRDMRIVFGFIVGIWFAPAMHIGSFYFTPELALLLGNAFAFLVSPKGRLMLTLTERNELARGVYEFVFAPNWRPKFAPGQYLEWTLPQGMKRDAKGNRRYFTIASGPSERYLRLGVKVGDLRSAFKTKLLALKVGDTISAAQLAGDFTLPKDRKRKLAFIAGGIGVTPFRSMVGEMILKKDKRDAVMLYSNKTVEEVAYYDVFERARAELGLRTVYALSDDQRTFEHAHTGAITPDLIRAEIPDYRERTFYISGPRGMVVAFTDALGALGLPPSQVKTDFFPGFV